MSLTKNDLQAIGELLDEKLEPVKAEQQVQSKILKEHSGILQEHSGILQEHSEVLKEHSGILKEHSGILQEHSEVLNGHGKTLKSLKSKVNRIDTLLDIVAKTYDERIVGSQRAIKRINDHLGLSSQN